MMVALDSYNRGHNALALCNCNILAICDLFLVPLHLSLVYALGIWCAPFLHSNREATFWLELCK